MDSTCAAKMWSWWCDSSARYSGTWAATFSSTLWSTRRGLCEICRHAVMQDGGRAGGLKRRQSWYKPPSQTARAQRVKRANLAATNEVAQSDTIPVAPVVAAEIIGEFTFKTAALQQFLSHFDSFGLGAGEVRYVSDAVDIQIFRLAEGVLMKGIKRRPKRRLFPTKVPGQELKDLSTPVVPTLSAQKDRQKSRRRRQNAKTSRPSFQRRRRRRRSRVLKLAVLKRSPADKG